MAVGEFRTIVYECEGGESGTDVARTAGWFFDFSAVDFNLKSVRADAAPEEGDFHVGDYGSCANDEAFDAYKFVGICEGCILVGVVANVEKR